MHAVRVHRGSSRVDTRRYVRTKGFERERRANEAAYTGPERYQPDLAVFIASSVRKR